ncbi:hypothetical protein, partial [Nocardiopsis algeriensis]|uniref:hypothetical protein n=1 Tax=Nocardiopsis algeriensis TaxID=1478215 RepID=UPI001C879B1D
PFAYSIPGLDDDKAEDADATAVFSYRLPASEDTPDGQEPDEQDPDSTAVLTRESLPEPEEEPDAAYPAAPERDVDEDTATAR